MLAKALPRETSFDVIVPMPLHWWKRWQRGFNQAELLAAMFPALDPVDTAARVLRTRQLIERDGELREILPVDPIATRAPSGCA
mgnify:CR=1 FL=1